MEDLKNKLKSGEQIIFSNERFQNEIGGDDVSFATLEFRDGLPTWAIGYKITFNGKLLHSSKTFKSFKNRLKKLVDKWNLEEVL